MLTVIGSLGLGVDIVHLVAKEKLINDPQTDQAHLLEMQSLSKQVIEDIEHATNLQLSLEMCQVPQIIVQGPS